MANLKEGFAGISDPLLQHMPKERLPEIPLQLQVMDSESYRLLEIDKLFDAVNFTQTRIGALALRRSLMQPLASTEVIRAKQESLRELHENGRLKQDLIEYVRSVAQSEKHLYDYFGGNYKRSSIISSYDNKPNIYATFKGAHKFLQSIADSAVYVEPSSEYLQILLGSLQNYRGSEVFEFIKGPVFRTPEGLRTKKDIKWFTPELKFIPTDFKPIRMMIALPAGILGYGLGAVLAIDFGRMFDDAKFIKPLRQLYFSDPHVASAIDSFGLIDELLSLDAYVDHVAGPVTLPVVSASDTHNFIAKGLRNPVLVRKEKPYIPNDVDLNGQRLTLLTGPNSGGKTSLCKTIAQVQVLAQIGAYIPAEEATIAVADRIFYHAPMVNSLEDDEGRFGVEAARTRDIFFQTTPRSLVILDELIEATTYEERLKHSYDILDGFWYKGGNTILVTHNHQLAEKFQEERRGQFLRVEFNGKLPTYKIIPGISTESHAEDVLDRLGFTRSHIQEHLKNWLYKT